MGSVGVCKYKLGSHSICSKSQCLHLILSNKIQPPLLACRSRQSLQQYELTSCTAREDYAHTCPGPHAPTLACMHSCTHAHTHSCMHAHTHAQMHTPAVMIWSFLELYTICLTWPLAQGMQDRNRSFSEVCWSSAARFRNENRESLLLGQGQCRGRTVRHTC